MPELRLQIFSLRDVLNEADEPHDFPGPVFEFSSIVSVNQFPESADLAEKLGYSCGELEYPYCEIAAALTATKLRVAVS